MSQKKERVHFFWKDPLNDPAFKSSMHRDNIVDKMMDYWINPGQR